MKNKYSQKFYWSYKFYFVILKFSKSQESYRTNRFDPRIIEVFKML